MRLVLNAREPFSLPAVIRSHGWIQLVPFSSEEPYSRFSYVLRLATGRMVELRIEQAPGGVSVDVDGITNEAERDEIARKVSWMLELDFDLSPFYGIAREEPKLSHAEAGGRGRVLRCSTLFEDVIKTILTTNTLWAATIRMNRNLVTLYGDPLPGGSTHAFPTPQRLAELDEETLRTQARLGYRSPYVLKLARAIASGELDLESLKTSELPTLELRKRLMGINGVGGYAAANLLMILGRYDYIPVDSWALKMVAHEWNGGSPVEPAAVEAAFARWGEWKGLAFWFWDWAYKG